MASLPDEHVIKVRAELDNAVLVRPGDTLVLGVSPSQWLTMQQADEIMARACALLPGVRVVVVPAGAMAVVRPDGA